MDKRFHCDTINIANRGGMIMRKILVMLAALCLVGCASECSVDEATLQSEGWVKNPEENGYVLASEVGESDANTTIDIEASATEQGKGLTFGLADSSTKALQDTVLEYLSGYNYNYREMYQIGTSVNDVPVVSTVEFVLDPENFNFYGLSELGTEKTLHYALNPNVSMYWTRQLRDAEEESGMTYFTSYGVQITGQVHIFTVDELKADPSELLHVFNTYYPTLATTAAMWNGMADDNAKIAYIEKVLGQQVVYKVVPSKIVVTQPYMLHLGGQYASCAIWTTKSANGYAYPDSFVSDAFLDEIIADKLSNKTFLSAVDAQYPEKSVTDSMSDDEKKAVETNNAMRALLLGENTCGIKTQQTLTDFTR